MGKSLVLITRTTSQSIGPSAMISTPTAPNRRPASHASDRNGKGAVALGTTLGITAAVSNDRTSARSNNDRSKTRDERATTWTKARCRRSIFAQSFRMAHDPKNAPSILVNGRASFKRGPWALERGLSRISRPAHETGRFEGTSGCRNPEHRAGDSRRPVSRRDAESPSTYFFGVSVFLTSAALAGGAAGGAAAGLVSAGFVSSFLGVGAGLVFRISWMYCSRIRAR